MTQTIFTDDMALVMNSLEVMLLLILFIQVKRLYRHEQKRLSLQMQLMASETFAHLKRFARNQLEVMRGDSGEYAFMDDAAMKKLAAYFLIGAAEYLGKQQGLSSAERKALSMYLLQHDLNLNDHEVDELYAQASTMKLDNRSNPIREGAKALKVWLDDAPKSSVIHLNQLLVKSL